MASEHGINGVKSGAMSVAAALAVAGAGSVAMAAPITMGAADQDFKAPGAIEDSLAGGASLAAFRAQAGLYVFDFSSTSSGSDDLSVIDFDLTGDAVTDVTVNLDFTNTVTSSDPTRSADTNDTQSTPTSPGHRLTGLGDAGWGATATQTYTFSTPVASAGIVYLPHYSRDLTIASVVFTLADDSVVNLGGDIVVSDEQPGNTDDGNDMFVGYIDTSGLGITSFTVTLQEPEYIGSGNWPGADDLAFSLVPEPASIALLAMGSLAIVSRRRR